jgi:hypothetical protein
MKNLLFLQLIIIFIIFGVRNLSKKLKILHVHL